MGRLEAGQSVSAVARTLGCSRQTIHNLRTRVQQTGAVADRPRPGHPLVTSRREDRQIRLRHLRNRFETAASTSRHLFRGRVSPFTIRNRLRTAGLQARRPYTGPIFTPFHLRQRLEWTRRHVRWNQRRWNNVVFSDEARFTLRFADGRVRVWRLTDLVEAA